MDVTATGNADDAPSEPGPSGENNERVDYEALAIPGTSGTSRNIGIVHTVDSSDEDNALPPLYHSTPERSNQHLPGSNIMADGITCTMYDGIVKTPIIVYPCNEPASWETNAVQVGEINEEPNKLYGSELDSFSYGSSFNWRIMEELLHSNEVPQRILPLCLAPSQVRLQSHYDATPFCILRYRPTKEAAEILRQLMSECNEVLSQCHIHVALIGSQFDNEVCRINSGQREVTVDVEVRVYQPTMSSANMVVGDIISGDDFPMNVRRAVGEAIVAAQAVRAQREVIVETRELRERQEMELRASFPAVANGEDEDEDDEEESRDVTVVDTEEVRKRRIEKFKQKEGPREPKIRKKNDGDDDEDANDSGTVTLARTT